MVFQFYLDQQSGVAAYVQIVQQVKHALRLGLLQPNDQLPTVREVVNQLAINPNTVLKAYRELEHDGLIASRPGIGTFIVGRLAGPDPALLAVLNQRLQEWVASAQAAGLDAESIQALMFEALHHTHREETA
jgi:GntR family transcriptional regulator